MTDYQHTYPSPHRAQMVKTNELAPHLTELRAALLQQRRFRLEQLRELAETPTTRDQARDEVTACLRTAATGALADIEAALDRLANDRYGRCEQCRSTIPSERLEILPMVRLCMRCQRDRETSRDH